VLAQAHTVAAHDRTRRRRLLWGQGLHGMLAGLGLVAMLGLALAGVQAGRVTAPHAAGVVFLTVATLELLAGVGLAWQSLHAARAAAARLRELTAQQPAVADATRDGADAAASRPPAELVLHQVAFGRPGQPRVLRGVDLRLAPGERIAIRGDSGCGKSTLSELVLRLWDPDEGRITWGGTDLRDMQQADWHAHIAWLPQGAPVFAGTVADNLRLGDPLAGDERLWQVLRDVKLAEWAERAEGLQTWVGENGATLSAGQARRLALARALLRPAPLMLLDEPTEGLDVDTADAVMRDLAAALGGRSLIVITHAPLPEGVVQRALWLRDGRLG
jgi:ATP-binding cassette subfamily C protein CydC